MRGKPIRIQRTRLEDRITPAHAGKTSIGDRKASGDADHPRTCGENFLFPPFRNIGVGSPPHMRGKRVTFGQTGQEIRITPAHAGKTEDFR